MEIPGNNGQKSTVLIVDDSPENISHISALLISEYRTKVALTGESALQLALRSDAPDLILLDILMDKMDGFEVCRQLKRNPATSEIPVIFLTSKSDVEDERLGLSLGAVDFITKPISPAILLARVRTHIQQKRMRDFLKDKSTFLEDEVNARTKEIMTIQDVAMIAMGSLAESRDNETGAHIHRTQQYVKELAQEVRRISKYKDELSTEMIATIFKSAPLHDIGKVGIPDQILLKDGKLTAAEFEIMKTHTTIGRNAIAAAERFLQKTSSFLNVAREIAYSHHERWDGRGYPEGLAGQSIPLAGRIMAVADVYDALISKRRYKPAFTHQDAVLMIREERGLHFDPDITDVFISLADQFQTIAQNFFDKR